MIDIFCLFFMLEVLPSSDFVNATIGDPDAHAVVEHIEHLLCVGPAIEDQPIYGAGVAQ